MIAKFRRWAFSDCFGSADGSHILILNVFINLGRDRSNTNSSWSQSDDQCTNGRWWLPSTGNSCLFKIQGI